MAYQFEAKGIITFDKAAVNEDALMEVALEAGADDVVDDGDTWEVRCAPHRLQPAQRGPQGGPVWSLRRPR